MKKNIFTFTLWTIVAALPMILVVLSYLVLDPFRVVWSYEPYFTKEKPMFVGWNRSYVTTETFNHHYKQEKYNSFIFGSSISLGYKKGFWQEHLPKDASIFHFDASMETLEGILLKMKYIESKGLKIDNALIVLYPNFKLKSFYEVPHLFSQHPDLTPEWDWYSFQKQYLQLYLNRDFVWDYLDVLINGLNDEVVQRGVFTRMVIDYDPQSNEEGYSDMDKMIEETPEKYYDKERVASFEKLSKNEIILPPLLDRESKNIMIEMKDILDRNKTNYKVIFAPDIKLQRTNPSDMKQIKEIFGVENIYNFQGINKWTSDYHNFYDQASHPRPKVCKEILDSIYK